MIEYLWNRNNKFWSIQIFIENKQYKFVHETNLTGIRRKKMIDCNYIKSWYLQKKL